MYFDMFSGASARGLAIVGWRYEAPHMIAARKVK